MTAKKHKQPLKAKHPVAKKRSKISSKLRLKHKSSKYKALLFAGGVAVAGGIWFLLSVLGATKPNITVIMLDDLDMQTVERIIDQKGGLGASQFPNIAELADEGTVFRNFIANAGICCTSRANFYLGTYSSQNKIWSNGDDLFFEKDVVDGVPGKGGGWYEFYRRGHGSRSINNALNNNYRTIFAGKYFNGYNLQNVPRPVSPVTCPAGAEKYYFPPGWNGWFGLLNGGYKSYNVNKNGCRVTVSGTGDQGAFLDGMTDFAKDQIGLAKSSNQPFFLMYSPFNVHAPGEVTDPATEWVKPEHLSQFSNIDYYYRCQGNYSNDDSNNDFSGNANDCTDYYSFNEKNKDSGSGLADKPAWVTGAQVSFSASEINSSYRKRLGALKNFDINLGKLIQELKAKGLYNNTYIILTSDQGFKLGEHGIGAGKNTQYEEDLKTPLIIKGPGVKRDKNYRSVHSMVDLHATIRHVAGAPAAGKGSSFLSNLRSGGGPSQSYAYSEGVRAIINDNPPANTNNIKYRVIRGNDNKKFIWTTSITPLGVPVPGSDFYEYYDLATDPAEMKSVLPGATAVAAYKAAITACEQGSCPSSIVIANPIVAATLSASPGTINAGASATLTWTSTNATGVTITPSVGGGALPVNGSATISPTTTTTYTITATGVAGTTPASATATVTVQTVTPITISGVSPSTGLNTGGTTVTITGTGFINGANVSIGGITANSISVLSPTSIRATTPAHSVGLKDVTVTIGTTSVTLSNSFTYTDGGGGGNLPVVNLSANPTTIAAGGSATLSWSSTGATSCTASDGWSGGRGLNGSEVVRPTVTKAFVLACTNTAGTTTRVVSVIVNPIVQPPTISSINPSSGLVKGGTFITITGTNFAPGAAVSIGGRPVTGVVVVNTSTITALTAKSPKGLKAVTVTNPNGQSASINNAFNYFRKRGDVDDDGLVNIVDLGALLSRWNSNDAQADFNEDGRVNIFDLGQLISNYNK